ncbi:MAG TPA: energy transducer TonB [Polyangia bacterium]|nr:energy transducer TonB [Polyangia bacterium]
MRTTTVLLSAAIHAGLAVGLISAQESRIAKKKTISVAVTGEKKKADKPKPPPPPVHRAAPKVVAALPKAETVTPVKAAAAPVATNLTMSNEDIGPGIGLQGAASAKEKAAAKSGPAAVKVASSISEKRTQRAREELGAGAAGEAPCNEEPTKPVPIVTTEISYSIYPQAQQDGIEGPFKARLIISASGEVAEVQILTSIDPGFDAALKAALMRWRFKPAMACGKPIDGGTFPVRARFELAD